MSVLYITLWGADKTWGTSEHMMGADKGDHQKKKS